MKNNLEVQDVINCIDNEDEICANHTCDECPLFQECYDTYDEVEDDYETMLPDEFIDKYLK